MWEEETNTKKTETNYKVKKKAWEAQHRDHCPPQQQCFTNFIVFQLNFSGKSLLCPVKPWNECSILLWIYIVEMCNHHAPAQINATFSGIILGLL